MDCQSPIPDSQKWKITGWGNKRRLKSKVDGKCATIQGNEIVTADCDKANTDQNWRKEILDDGSTLFRNKTEGNPDRCFDQNYLGAVYPHGCNVGRNQRWRTMRNYDKWKAAGGVG
jgi:hypothetical protein